MNIKYFAPIFLLSAFSISGCVTGQEFTSNVNPDSVVYSAAASQNVSDIYIQYSDCLSGAFVRISEERIRNNELPDMRAKTYEDECIRQERLLYQAFYSASRDHDPNGPEDFAHNTAIRGVEQVKQITFEAIAEGFQPPQ